MLWCGVRYGCTLGVYKLGVYKPTIRNVSHMGATWVPRGCHMGATWVPRGCHMGATWVPHGCHMVSKRGIPGGTEGQGA